MKKLAAILLCAAVSMSVFGCGSKKEPENGANTASKYESADRKSTRLNSSH